MSVSRDAGLSTLALPPTRVFVGSRARTLPDNQFSPLVLRRARGESAHFSPTFLPQRALPGDELPGDELPGDEISSPPQRETTPRLHAGGPFAAWPSQGHARSPQAPRMSKYNAARGESRTPR